ncbi:hypothetical protein SAMN05428967_2255 [Phyllobacterium sp. YR620]|uniref:hypothetical protein n=1 Tax=Phyllobacterium sp. YR620 TaxID=1881066 RepID=UPI000888F5D7|nr:hypothetical protein [Phyllobacterium sp. YR620]SDP46846.1 hypothetical protein SAMN05428967_2255 [Phyllobacterium sp. YR620]
MLEDIFRVLEERLPQPADPDELTRGMIAIAPFDAEDIDDKPLKVVGVVSNGVMLDFIVMKTDKDDGSIFPSIEGNVWPLKPRQAA